jgi:hypothetical protein
MGQQKIIRNVSTMDRGPVVRVTTEDVLQAVRAYVGDFTTYDIARVLGTEEYPVRAAMSWLVKRGIVERIGTTERTLLPVKGRRLHGDTYTVALYRAKEEAAPVDFSALNRAFGFA